MKRCQAWGAHAVRTEMGQHGQGIREHGARCEGERTWHGANGNPRSQHVNVVVATIAGVHMYHDEEIGAEAARKEVLV